MNRNVAGSLRIVRAFFLGERGADFRQQCGIYLFDEESPPSLAVAATRKGFVKLGNTRAICEWQAYKGALEREDKVGLACGEAATSLWRGMWRRCGGAVAIASLLQGQPLYSKLRFLDYRASCRIQN